MSEHTFKSRYSSLVNQIRSSNVTVILRFCVDNTGQAAGSKK